MQAPDGDPLLILNRVGKGRTALLLSDQIWLWSRGHEGGGPQAELLRRVAHWLMQEPALEENALTAQVADGRLTIERRSTDPAPPGAVTVTDPDGKTQNLPLTETAPAGPRRGWRRRRRGMAGERRAAHRLCRRRGRQSAGDRRSARHGDTGRQAGAGVGRRRALAGHRCLAGRAGAAPDRAGSGRVGEFVGRTGAAARSPRHRHCGAGAAAVLACLPLMLGLMVGAWRREGTVGVTYPALRAGEVEMRSDRG